ncbi:MAG: helix-turn-helix transcriptional regulator [Prevotella sp.]|nr:helix-turn-helix transcriptional regulator [Prevotella sp.]
MNRWQTIDQQLQHISLNNFGQRQLESFRQCVLSLMASGTPTVEKVADAMAMHPTKLRRRVKLLTGVPANTYFTYLRIHHAMEMLGEYPLYKVHQVACACGFADTAHLCHVFRCWTDQSPMEFMDDVKKSFLNQQ